MKGGDSESSCVIRERLKLSRPISVRNDIDQVTNDLKMSQAQD